MLVDLAYVVLGVAGLYAGARWLVRAASSLAISFGLSRTVTGLTVVALGISAPALAVNITASLMNSGELALGNVIGSNMAGIGLGLGIAGLVTALVVNDLKIKSRLRVLAVLAFLVALMAYDGELGRAEGYFLVLTYVGYTIYTILFARYDIAEGDDVGVTVSRLRETAVLLAGLVAVAAGARGMVIGADRIASGNGIDGVLIGITLVALATSLPVLVAAIGSARSGNPEQAVGSVVGSTVSNLLLVLGITVIISPMTLAPASMRFGFGATLILALALLPMLRDRRFSRVESSILVVAYLAFVTLAIFVVFD